MKGAIYSHQGQTYLVDRLDWEGRLADVRPVEVDYYTRASIDATIQELTPALETDRHGRRLLRAYRRRPGGVAGDRAIAR